MNGLRRACASGFGYALLISLPAVLFACKGFDRSRPVECGMDPDSLRFLEERGSLNTADSECRLCLDRLEIENNMTVIYIAHRRDDALPRAYYSSSDGCLTWKRVQSPSDSATNITSVEFGDLMEIASSANSNIRYENQAFWIGPPRFRRSLDGGKTFFDVKPGIDVGQKPLPTAFIVISTGFREPGRVYARGTLDKETAVYSSSDYGDHFTLLKDHVAYVVESRAQSSILYACGDAGFIRSKDNGVNWEHPKGEDVLYYPIYLNRREGRISTKRIESADDEWFSLSWLRQIATDPIDPDIIYVKCDKGLYKSIDGGDTFRLLPLATDKYREIAKIAVDPMDGKRLYAILGTSSLYRSSDGGCSWTPVSPPAE